MARRSVMERFDLGGLFQPDVLLASQVAARRGRQPEQQLQLAVLVQAVEDLRRVVAHAPINPMLRSGVRRSDLDIRRIRHEQRRDAEQAESIRATAQAWVASALRDGPFTFIAICESLGLDPDWVRRGLAAPPPAAA